MHKQGQVIRWEADRGFGFIRSPDTSMDIFFHIRDFRGPGAPIEGLAVAYEEIHVGGKGPRAMAVQGMGARQASTSPRSRPVKHLGQRRPFRRAGDRWLPWVLMLGLACAGLLLRLVQEGRLPFVVIVIGVLINALTFWFYWRDKYAAQKRTWRTPERVLHGLSFLGGWPAARIAQQMLRHKSAKASFQQTYWLTVWLNVGGLLAWAWPSVKAWAAL